MPTSLSESGLVLRFSLSACAAGRSEPGISVAGMPSSVPVGAELFIGGDVTSCVSSESANGLSVASLDAAVLAGPLVGAFTGGSVPGAAVGANASCGAAVVGGANEGARGCGLGGAGRGAGGFGAGGAGRVAA